MMNLTTDRWIPVIRSDGTTDTIAPWEITTGNTQPVRLNTTRPDFDGSIIQFLIGLVQVTMPPVTNREWLRRFKTPPSPQELETAFMKYVDAFNFYGDHSRFMQDGDFERKTARSIERLFVGAPGKQTLDFNTDHFQKRHTLNHICVHCGVMALLTAQLTTGDGTGYRTSIRGAGPLTTLVMGKTLWETVWLNVLCQDQFETLGNASKDARMDLFPWMGPGLTSENDETIHAVDAHPAQVFFATPWRIWIDFDNPKSGKCDICGRTSDALISQYFAKNYGGNYGNTWRHPLTPYYQSASKEMLPTHGSPKGLSYKHWLGMVQVDPTRGNLPALTVQVFRNERQDYLVEHLGYSTPLWIFGYKMENAKAVCWNDGTMPLFYIDNAFREQYENVITAFVETTSYVASTTEMCIKEAIFKKDGNVISEVVPRFWHETECAFYDMLATLRSTIERGEDLTPLKKRWHEIISRKAKELFRIYSQVSVISNVNPERIADARNHLQRSIAIGSRRIRKILDIMENESEQDGVNVHDRE
jgi:CRISPR system Cascade subunit CasA